MSSVASIQIIKKIEVHPNADKLEIASILGYKCVVRKGEYKEGDMIIYIEVDALLPLEPRFEFVGNLKKSEDGKEGYLIKPIKLRGEISFGLIMPLSLLNISEYLDLEEGVDVSELLNIVHYQKPVPANMVGKMRGGFPSFLRKTDETRVHSEPKLLESLLGSSYYITEKVDGCLDENTVLETTKGFKTIKEICEKGLTYKVKGYDLNKKQECFTEVTNHFVHNRDLVWYEILLENGLTLKVTENHKIYLPNIDCWREAKNLIEGDSVLVSY